MSGDIQFGLKLTYDGKAVAGGAAASTEQIKAIGETAKKAGGEATQAFDRSAISAKQMSAAMRGVPAQFTDIFTSIAAGQNPMQVMLQQGGQLKDMFGGIGPAARALGGYIVGMVNPYTVAAAAAAGLAFVHRAGAKESEAYTRALILTGAAAETTASRLADTAAQVAKATGATKGAVADALAQAAGSGTIASGSLEIVAAAAVRMQRATGKAIEDTVAEFDKLARDPVAASRKLDEQYNYLTASIHKQIRALQEQGRYTDAAALAIKAYADAMSERGDQIEKSLGSLERTWKRVAGVAKGAWDAMLDIGRKDGLAEKIDAAEKRVQTLSNAIRALGAKNKQPELDEANRELAALKAQKAALDAVATAEGDRNEQEKARKKWQDQDLAYLTTKAKLDLDIKRIRNEGAAGGLPQSEIDARVAKASESWTKALSGARLDAEGTRLKAWHEEYRDTVKRALDESRVDYEGYWALVTAGERHLAEEQLRLAQGRLKGAQGRQEDAEVIKLKGEIDALQARLKTGIAAASDRGLAGDREKAKTSGDNTQLDWINADTKALEAAATWRRENLSLIDQELLAARAKSAADLRERQAQLTKNDALKHAPELLKHYQQVATDQAASTLAGIEAEIRARRDANAEWINGAKAASRDYVESVADAAGQAKRAWSGTWKRAEDDLTAMLSGGKASVADFARYAIAEFNRIAIVQPMVSKLAGFAGGFFDKLFPSGSSSATTGNATTGLPTGTVLSGGVTVSAKGNVFASPDLHQYANTIVDHPTRFRFAKGAAIGEMGEAGPEAIMPLKRGKDGSLGIAAHDGAGGGAIHLTYAPVFEIDARGAAVGVGPMLNGVVEAASQRALSTLMNDLNNGGQFAYATGRRS
jgi:lambda family phage tail tape measure protein